MAKKRIHVDEIIKARDDLTDAMIAESRDVTTKLRQLGVARRPYGLAGPQTKRRASLGTRNEEERHTFHLKQP